MADLHLALMPNMDQPAPVSPVISNISKGENLMGRYLFYLIVGLVVIGEIIILALFVPGRVSSINTLLGDINTLQHQVTEIEGQIAALQGLDQNQVASELQAATTALPSEKKVSGLVTGLTNLASTSGTLLLGLDLSPGVISSSGAIPVPGAQAANDVPLSQGVYGIPMSLSVAGGESQIEDLMTKLQQTAPMIGINSVDYKTGATGSQTSLNLNLFYLPLQNMTVNRADIVPLTAQNQATLQSLSTRIMVTQ